MALKPLSPRSRHGFRVRVPCSTSNVGSGFDALGIALDLFLEARWKPAERTRLERRGALAESLLKTGQDPVLRGMRRAAILAGAQLPPGEILVSAPFPPGRGLGASGAGLAAGLLLGDRLTGAGLSREVLLAEAVQLEGHPENATASLLGGAHWSCPDEDGRWLHHPVRLHRDLRFLLVIPPYQLDTRRAREVLPSSVALARAVQQARRTPLLLEGLRSLDPQLLRIGTGDDLHVAPRLRLLAGADRILEAARKAGALAATLSGAGSAMLVLGSSAAIEPLEKVLQARVRRLWGEAGQVIRARARSGAPEVQRAPA